MYKIQFFILILILSVSCKHDKPKPIAAKEVTPPIEVKKNVINDSISGYIHPKLGLFSFKFDVDTARQELKKIKIYTEGKLVQTINTSKVCENNQFSLIDWNFDGYKDISVISNCGSGGCAYWIWNYSPKLKKFVYNTVLSERLGLEMDSVSKYIVFHYRAGSETEKWDTMKYVNNKLVFVKGLHIERGSDGVSITSSKMVNNKIVSIKR